MRIHRSIAFVLASVLCWFALSSPAHADETAAWAALKAGNGVALMRHAEAPGVGDPEGFKLDDCSTQRNLSDGGRADARAVGARLKAEGVPVGRILSSPWCRCLETARLLGAGPVDASPAFASSFRDTRGEEIAQQARAVIREWNGPGTLIVVTHQVNISALTSFNPGSGDIIVVSARPDGSLIEHGTLRLAPR